MAAVNGCLGPVMLLAKPLEVLRSVTAAFVQGDDVIEFIADPDDALSVALDAEGVLHGQAAAQQLEFPTREPAGGIVWFCGHSALSSSSMSLSK